jgi:hypothetical protein
MDIGLFLLHQKVVDAANFWMAGYPETIQKR